MNAMNPGKVTLANVDAEIQLLGAILINNNAYYTVSSFLKTEHFHEPVNRIIYPAMAQMIEEGKRCNAITLKTYLPTNEIAEGFTIGDYLARMAAEAVTIVNAPDYGRLILELALKREIIGACHHVEDELTTPGNDTPIRKVCADLYMDIARIDGFAKEGQGSSNYGDLLTRAHEALRKETTGEGDIRMPWVLPEIQEVAGYMRTGNLIGVMSDSGGGKTSLSLQQARFSAEQGFRVAFFSIEVTEEEAALQAACQKLQIPMESMDSLELTSEQEDALVVEMASDLPFKIVGFSQCDLQAIRSTCLSLKRQWGLHQVIIDHAKLIDLPGKSNDLFSERVNELYRGLKRIAKEVGIAIIILIQRNDNWKKRGSPRPMEGDAYGGGGVKQNLDVWFSLYRPDVFKDHFNQMIRDARKQEDKDRLTQEMDKSRDKAWFINHKRRRGAPGRSKPVLFKGQTVTFQSLPEFEPRLGEF